MNPEPSMPGPLESECADIHTVIFMKKIPVFGEIGYNWIIQHNDTPHSMFDGSILPRRRVSMSRGPLSISIDKNEAIRKYKSGKIIAVFLKGFIQRKRWKLQLQQRLHLLKCQILHNNSDISDETVEKVWEMVRISYFAKIRDFETLNLLSELVDLGKITKESQHIFLLRLFTRLFMTYECYKNVGFVYPLTNMLYISGDIYDNDSINFLAYAGSMTLSKMEMRFLDKISLILRNFGNKINCSQFHLTFWGTHSFSSESLNNFNLTKIFDSMTVSVSDCLFISPEIIVPLLFDQNIFCKNISTVLNYSTDGDFIQTILLSLAHMPSVVDVIKVDWPKIFRIIGSSRKGSLFIAIKYSKYLKGTSCFI